MNKIKISYLLPLHIENQHKQLKIAVDEISELIKKKESDFRAEEEKVDFVEFDNDQFEHESEYLEDQRDILQSISQTLYSSLFISIYSHFEINFSALIKEVEKSTNHRIKSKDLRRDGSTINCFINYLILVHSIDLLNFKNNIQYLSDLTFIRNIFTHSRGLVPKENNKSRTQFLNFIKSTKGIELKENQIIISDKRFILKVIEENNIFLIRLINHLNEN